MSHNEMFQDLAYTIIYVKDMDKCTAFYRDALEMPVDFAADGWTQFKTNGAALVLHPKTDGAGSPDGNNVHLSFRVDDLDSIYRKLSGQVKFLAPPASASFGKHATLCDPEGNQIDLVEWSPRARLVSDQTVVNDILVKTPEAMQVLEEHGIRICGGCIVLLNGTVRQTAEYSGLSAAETSRMVEELNDTMHASHQI